jgi:hypothetical protein
MFFGVTAATAAELPGNRLCFSTQMKQPGWAECTMPAGLDLTRPQLNTGVEA